MQFLKNNIVHTKINTNTANYHKVHMQSDNYYELSIKIKKQQNVLLMIKMGLRIPFFLNL